MKFRTQYSCFACVAAALLAIWCFSELAPVSGQDGVPSNASKPVKKTAEPGVEPTPSSESSYSNAAPKKKPKKKYLYSFQGQKNAGKSRDITAQTMIQQATKKFKTAKTDDEKQAARKGMTAGLSRYFDDDIKKREAGIVKIEERVKKLRVQLEKRQEAKDRLVDLQVQLLINEANGLGFYSSPNSQSFSRSWLDYPAPLVRSSTPWSYNPQDVSSGTPGVEPPQQPRGSKTLRRSLAPGESNLYPPTDASGAVQPTPVRPSTVPGNTETYERRKAKPAKKPKSENVPAEAKEAPAKPSEPVPVEAAKSEEVPAS